MHTLINRSSKAVVYERLANNPVVALIGPRQCGKSTLAHAIAETQKKTIYLDLEKHSDLNRLREPEFFFQHNKDALIILDEIQRAPDLFPLIRATVDENRRSSQFLILGSASPQLIRQSSESLAGRISYIELTPFTLKEIANNKTQNINTLWLKGGFPRSFLAQSDELSLQWRLDFIQTFLEQDLSNLGIRIPAEKISRFWRMFAHINAQVLNSAKLANSLGVSGHTVKHYILLLRHTFMLRVLEPFFINTKKRLIKSPKVYIRDSGLLHALLNIETTNDLLAHPTFGSSWEGFVVEQILSCFPRINAGFYRNSNGNEIDLILEQKQKRIAVECKASLSPQLKPGLKIAMDDLGIKQAWIIAPVKESYQLTKDITVSPLKNFLKIL